jgi:integrase
LAEAREIAKSLKVDIALGKDPQAEKVAKRNMPKPKTIKDLSEAFKKKHLPNLKESTQIDYERRIDNVIVPAIGPKPLSTITRYEIIEFLEEIADGDGTPDDAAPIQSNRVRAVLSSMYSFGINRGITEHNPVLGIKPLGKENRRKRVYDRNEIKDIWAAFEKEPEPYRSLFKMLLICGQRSGETRQMKWIYISNNIWTIPAEITKAGRTHHVPLPPMAIDLLSKLKSKNHHSEYVFQSPALEGSYPISWLQKAAGRVKRNSKVEDFRLHDLRRTAASYMAEAGVDRTVLGKLLNHKGLAGDNQVTAVYDRFDYMEEKKRALIRWGSCLENILNENQKSNIIRMN